MLLLIDNYDSFTYNLVHYFGEEGADVRVVRNDDLTAAEAGVPLLGVCLGHQTIGQAFGGKVVRHTEIVHGKMGTIHHSGKGVFTGLPSPLLGTRYHSLVVERDSLPDCLEVTAWLEDGTIMGLRHKTLPVEGVQFHPESIRSEHGHAMVRNFLASVKDNEKVPA